MEDACEELLVAASLDANPPFMPPTAQKRLDDLKKEGRENIAPEKEETA